MPGDSDTDSGPKLRLGPLGSHAKVYGRVLRVQRVLRGG